MDPLPVWTRKTDSTMPALDAGVQVTHPLRGPWASGDGFKSHPVPEAAYAAIEADPMVRMLAVVASGSGLLVRADPAAGYARVAPGQFAFYGAELRVASGAQEPLVLVLPTAEYARAIGAAATSSVAADDRLLLRAVIDSAGINNTVVNNFLSQMNPVMDLVRRHGFEVGPVAAVVGCGQVPWAPLRLLAEGARRVFANDLLPVQPQWSPDDIALLSEALQRVAPHLARNLMSAGVDSETLVVRGGVRFEHAGLDEDSVDFLFSTSVLEHVDDPDAVYAEMARVVRSGGAAYHSIDLRDHRDFDRPLDFLELSDAEYSEWDTENRLRAADHVRLLEESGYEILETTAQVVAGSPDPVTGGSPTTWITGGYLPEEGLSVGLMSRFDSRFRQRDAREMAVLCLQVLARRR